MITLQTQRHFEDVLRQAWGRISTSGGHSVSAPSLDSAAIRSGNAYDSEAKGLRNTIHNDCVFLTPNGLSAEWGTWRKMSLAILGKEEIITTGLQFFAWISESKRRKQDNCTFRKKLVFNRLQTNHCGPQGCSPHLEITEGKEGADSDLFQLCNQFPSRPATNYTLPDWPHRRSAKERSTAYDTHSEVQLSQM